MATNTPLLILAAMLITGTVACTPEQDADSAGAAADTSVTAAEPQMPSEPMAPAPTGPGAEGEALAFLVTVNEHEIAAAEQARSKQVDGEVRKYADMLHAEHTSNLAQTKALSQSAGVDVAQTAEVQAMKAKGEAEIQRLDAMEGDAYETAYLAAMVDGHTEALALIDARLMAAVTSEPVRQHLATTRAAIAKHLDAAKALQGGSNP